MLKAINTWAGSNSKGLKGVSGKIPYEFGCVNCVLFVAESLDAVGQTKKERGGVVFATVGFEGF